MTVMEQARVFGAMGICGAALGAVYDVLRLILRGGFMPVLDLALGVAAAAGMILTALMLETEAFRLYAFAGVLLGIGLYMLTIGAIIRKMSGVVRNFVKKEDFCIKNGAVMQENTGKARMFNILHVNLQEESGWKRKR